MKTTGYHPRLHEFWLSSTCDPPIKEMAVPGRLNAFIEGIFELDHRQEATGRALILPDLNPHIVLAFEKISGNVGIKVIGPRSKAIYSHRQKREKTVIIRFRAAGLSFFTEKNIRELKNAAFFLNEVFNNFQLRRRKEPMLTELLDRLESLIAEKPPPGHSQRRLSNLFLDLVKKQQGQLKIKEAASTLGCSDRYLRKSLIHTTGMKPNFAIRLERLTRSFLYRQKHPNYTLSDIAHLSGYFDHSHMVDDYQAMMGKSPGQLVVRN